MSIQPYTLQIPQATIDNLKKRLGRTRWPDEVDGAGWEYGTNLAYMQELVEYWQNTYDWRAQEADLNRFAQFSTEIDGEEIRFIHVRGNGPNPLPILLFHGWPDSFYRYHKLIPLLTDPAAHGGSATDTFDVVIPTSLIGPQPGGPRPQLLRQWATLGWKLMTDVLGYQRFAAAGGDGGSVLAQLIAVEHPESTIGIHLTDIGFHTLRASYSDLSEAEQAYLTTSQQVGFQEGAYAMLQGTRPQTLAYGLHDSPAGWAAWVIEKFRTWSDCDGDLERSFTKDVLLTNIMINWLAGIDPRGYKEEFIAPSITPDQRVEVPVGVALPPRDFGPLPPREYAERTLKNLQRWTILPRGGHFVALEDPEPLAQDMRAFFQMLR